MNTDEGIFIHGIGAVSPAGWGVPALREALARNEPIATREILRPGWEQPAQVRQVPTPSTRPAFMAHARLRRTSPIAHYSVAAALEALGNDAAECSNGSFRLGIVLCAMSGCVNYSRRFYDEVLKEPATASPLVFPETVYNSPASHLAALLGSTAVSYTLVGDPGTFLQGLVLAADWLTGQRVDGCVVIGAEEMDWLTADAMRLFDRRTIVSDGAGAIYLRREPKGHPGVRLHAVTGSHLFCGPRSRPGAARQARAELNGDSANHLLCDGLLGLRCPDKDEQAAWQDWAGRRLSLKTVLGEGLMAAAAWQCVAAADALQRNVCDAAAVSVVGCNQQAIAARFIRTNGCT